MARQNGRPLYTLTPQLKLTFQLQAPGSTPDTTYYTRLPESSLHHYWSHLSRPLCRRPFYRYAALVVATVATRVRVTRRVTSCVVREAVSFRRTGSTI